MRRLNLQQRLERKGDTQHTTTALFVTIKRYCYVQNIKALRTKRQQAHNSTPTPCISRLHNMSIQTRSVVLQYIQSALVGAAERPTTHSRSPNSRSASFPPSQSYSSGSRNCDHRAQHTHVRPLSRHKRTQTYKQKKQERSAVVGCEHHTKTGRKRTVSMAGLLHTGDHNHALNLATHVKTGAHLWNMAPNLAISCRTSA